MVSLTRILKVEYTGNKHEKRNRPLMMNTSISFVKYMYQASSIDSWRLQTKKSL